VNRPIVAVKGRREQSIPEAHALPELSDSTMSRLANVCRLLSEKSRLRMILALARGREMPVAELVALAGLSRTAVSNNLKLMRLAGLVNCRRQGKTHMYGLASDCVRDLLQRVSQGMGEG